MTSNLGSHEIQRLAGEEPDVIKGTVMGEVRKHFRPEFINRIDEMSCSTRSTTRRSRRSRRSRSSASSSGWPRKDMKLDVSDAALAEVAKVGFDPLYGARPLKRAIQPADREPGGAAGARRPVRAEGRDSGRLQEGRVHVRTDRPLTRPGGSPADVARQPGSSIPTVRGPNDRPALA